MQQNTTQNKTATNSQNVEILNPVAEYKGTLIHECGNGCLHYFDRDGHMHTRNNQLGKTERMAWIKKDIDWYAKNGWLN